MKTQLFDTAKAVLLNRQEGNSTQSAPNNITFPRYWDNGFIALAYGHFDLDLAAQQFQQLFKRQESNGLLTTNSQGKTLLQNQPSDLESSIRQFSGKASADIPATDFIAPPVYGFILWHIYENSRNKKLAKSMLREFFPKIKALHQYLYDHSDPLDEGLISVERGYGTSFESTSSLIQDPLFNGILTYSNECLIKIGSLLKEDIHEIMDWHELTIYSMNEKLWDEERGIYNAYNVDKEALIPVWDISGFMPMLGEVPTQEQAEAMLLHLESAHFGGDNREGYFCPTYSLLQPDLDYKKDGKGAINMTMNWMLYEGLCRYDMYEIADRLYEDSLALISNYGFQESYDPRKGKGDYKGNKAGSHAGSAAIAIDFLSGE